MTRPAKLSEIRDAVEADGIGKSVPSYMKEIGVESFVEIGIREGRDFFGRHMSGIANGGTAYAIDIWQETGNPAQNDAGLPQNILDNQYRMFINKVSIHNANVEEEGGVKVVAVREFSEKAPDTLGLEPESLDWVFIDADHSYEGCKGDIEAWWPLVKPGGVLCGHDYMINETTWRGVRVGVKDAVTEFAEREGLEVYVGPEKFFDIPGACPTWYVVKGEK